MSIPQEKITRLTQRLKDLKKVAVAFSGGKDSYFLLKMAVDTLGKENAVAFFVKTRLITPNDEKRVDYFTQKLDFNLERLFIDVTNEPVVMKNPKDRCYHCKLKIFKTLQQEAATRGIGTLLDGSTHSDLDEYRPGRKAIEELGVVSPLEEAGITSAEIVAHLRDAWKVEHFFTTSSTCLATRFPYDFTLTEEILQAFSDIETYFVDSGIYPVKIRYIRDGIRIETPAANFPRILENKKNILDFCQKRGMKFVTLDIEGLKSGVWD